MNQLGNLTVILGKWNQEMSNRDFDEKRHWYADSRLQMNKDLAALDGFTASDIAARQKKIALKAEQLWSAKWG